MNQSSDAAEQIVRMSLEGIEVAAKISGSGAKNIAVLLYTVMKDKEQTAGKTKLSKMLKSGKPLNVFSLKKEDLKKFQEEAKRYGILYCALIDKKDKSSDGVVDIVVRKEDAPRINRIIERFKLSSYDKAEIVADIEKTKEMNKGVEVKDKEENVVKDKNDKNKKKDGKSLNPQVAKTEKSPQSEPTLKEPKNSMVEGKTVKDKKKSVREKLNNYRKIINRKDKSKTKELSKSKKSKDKCI